MIDQSTPRTPTALPWGIAKPGRRAHMPRQSKTPTPITLLLPFLLCTSLLPILTRASVTPTIQPVSIADQARYQRGEKIRQLLLDALEQSFTNNGSWPQQLPPNGLDLVYVTPPNSVTLQESASVMRFASKAPATVVLYERFDQHPDGVWVGYADGHLEFAPTPAQLKDCQSQLSLVAQQPPEPTTQPAPTDGQLTVKVIDPDDKPVTGARIGTYMSFGFKNIKVQQPVFPGDDANSSPISDDNGEATIRATTAFDAKFTDQPSVPVYVYQKDRQLIAEINLNHADFAQNHQLTIHLTPACNVHGTITSVGLNAKGKNLSWTNVLVFKPGQLRWYTLQSSSEAGTFQLPLPPGDYGLEAYGTDCSGIYRYIHIAPGQSEADLHLDLPPDRVTQLTGQPAPEFRQIKGWKNGGPVKLADLRGKIVILDFWEYGCGPCVASMPQFMKLYDDTKDKGLVIIAVHNDSLSSIAELDQKLEELRQEVWPGWKGRNLPFLIALDSGGETRIKYTSFTSEGATTAAYGINGYPTTIAIGRDGNVIGEVSVRSDEGLRHIESLLDSNAPPKN
jgi:thiol-disulfide isomerase/thioredoxin